MATTRFHSTNSREQTKTGRFSRSAMERILAPVRPNPNIPLWSATTLGHVSIAQPFGVILDANLLLLMKRVSTRY
jgi:hypothetical protein